MKQPRADRVITLAGGYGADIQLTHTRSTNQVYWSPRFNSYVLMNQDGWGRREPIRRLTIASINGLGEIRWVINPEDPHASCDGEAQLAVNYFFEEQ